MADQRDPQTYAIIGAGMEVHRELGPGFLERVYQDALEIEFRERGIPYQRERECPIGYTTHTLPSIYRADFICYDQVILEIKANRLCPRSTKPRLSIISRPPGSEWLY